jgi:hypothetical protein
MKKRPFEPKDFPLHYIDGNLTIDYVEFVSKLVMPNNHYEVDLATLFLDIRDKYLYTKWTEETKETIKQDMANKFNDEFYPVVSVVDKELTLDDIKVGEMYYSPYSDYPCKVDEERKSDFIVTEITLSRQTSFAVNKHRFVMWVNGDPNHNNYNIIPCYNCGKVLDREDAQYSHIVKQSLCERCYETSMGNVTIETTNPNLKYHSEVYSMDLHAKIEDGKVLVSIDHGNTYFEVTGLFSREIEKELLF